MRVTALLVLSIGFVSCNRNTDNQHGGQYFDLKGFFDKEIGRLNKANAPVLKTVSRNGGKETKTLIVDWKNELSLFSESDLNKPAWKNSYRTVSNRKNIEYIALEDNLKTRRIKIIRSGGRIKAVLIINKTKNLLYNSDEKLVYYPDSLYSVDKNQRVKLLGANRYIITGRLK